ncbi:MAG: peptidoglycan-binding domain-containing protein [Bacteroidia bacterium]|nr:peptidoglycan-binding domain-containing protein [Bacteroidia bacterium]
MKRLFYLVVILSLPVLVFFQYDRYTRFHPPSDYAYPPAAGIDSAYFDPRTVQDYYAACGQSGTWARHCWKEWKIDVRAADPADEAARPCLERYQELLARARWLEQQLLASARLKALGYSNDDIRSMAAQGLSPAAYELRRITENPVLARSGDRSAAVFAIQQRLSTLGYSLPVDGIYRTETELAISRFQASRGLFPSGQADRLTLLRLIAAADSSAHP